MNNNNVLIGVIIAAVVVVVGVMLYSSNRQSEVAEPVPSVADLSGDEEMMIEGESMMAEDAMMESTIVVPTPSSVATTSPLTTTAVTAVGAVKEFTVAGSNFKFSPAEMRVKQGDTVRVTFKNEGGTHDWKLDEFNAATKVIQTGQEETIEFVANKKGQFEYYCSVGQHRQLGMKGTLIVE